MRGTVARQDPQAAEACPASAMFGQTTPADIDRLLDAFFALKSIHMAQQGLTNVFAAPGVAGVPAPRLPSASYPTAGPIIEIHALEADAEVLALFAVVADDHRCTSMFNTYTLSENARHSPGLILIRHMVLDCADARIARLRSRRRQGGLQIGLLQRGRTLVRYHPRAHHRSDDVGARVSAPPSPPSASSSEKPALWASRTGAPPPARPSLSRRSPHRGQPARQAAAMIACGVSVRPGPPTSTVTSAKPASSQAFFRRDGGRIIAAHPRPTRTRCDKAGEPVEPASAAVPASIDHVVVAASKRFERDRQPLRRHDGGRVDARLPGHDQVDAGVPIARDDLAERCRAADKIDNARQRPDRWRSPRDWATRAQDRSAPPGPAWRAARERNCGHRRTDVMRCADHGDPARQARRPR